MAKPRLQHSRFTILFAFIGIRTSATTLLAERYRLRRVSGIPNHVVAVGNNAATVRRDNARRTSSQCRPNQNQHTWAGDLRREARVVIENAVLQERGVNRSTSALHVEATRIVDYVSIFNHGAGVRSPHQIDTVLREIPDGTLANSSGSSSDNLDPI